MHMRCVEIILNIFLPSAAITSYIKRKRKKFLFFNLNKSTPDDFPESYSILFFESACINYCEKEQQSQFGIKYQLFTLIIQYCVQGIMTKLKNPFMIDGVISNLHCIRSNKTS